MGEQHPATSPPTWTEVPNNIKIATDVTVKRGHGGAAYSIHSRSTPRTLQSVIPVDGNPKFTTLYRTELFGILGAIVAVHHLLSVSGIMWRSLTGTLWCDNKAAVNKYNELNDDLPFSLTEANELNADVL